MEDLYKKLEVLPGDTIKRIKIFLSDSKLEEVEKIKIINICTDIYKDAICQCRK